MHDPIVVAEILGERGEVVRNGELLFRTVLVSYRNKDTVEHMI